MHYEQEWNKQLIFSLLTDFNIDKEGHIQLFLMAKQGILTEYILKLIKEDLARRESSLLDPIVCNKIILQEMGYAIENDHKYLEELSSELIELQKNKQIRVEKLEIENNNLISKKFENKNCLNKQSNQNNSIKDAKDEENQNGLEVNNEEKTMLIEETNETEISLKVSDMKDLYNNINLSTSEKNALDEIAGLAL